MLKKMAVLLALGSFGFNQARAAETAPAAPPEGGTVTPPTEGEKPAVEVKKKPKKHGKKKGVAAPHGEGAASHGEEAKH